MYADDVAEEETVHPSFARPKKQTHLKAVSGGGDRVSCDSGISLEDPGLLTTPNPPLVRRPKAGGSVGGAAGTSLVRRLTQLFENLTHDELRHEQERQEQGSQHATMASSLTSTPAATVHTSHQWPTQQEQLQEVAEEDDPVTTTPEVCETNDVPQVVVVPCQLVSTTADYSELAATTAAVDAGVESEVRNDAEIAQDALEQEDRVMALSVRASSGGAVAGKRRLSRRRRTQDGGGVGRVSAARGLLSHSGELQAPGDKHDGPAALLHCYDDYIDDDDEFDTSEDEAVEHATGVGGR